MTVMAGAIVTPSLPQMLTHFSEVPNSALLVRLVLTLPALFVGFGSPLAGWLLDRMGRRPILFFSLVLYGLGGTAGFWTTDLYHLLVTRALLGLGVAGIMTSSSTLVADYFKGPLYFRFMGFQVMAMALGGVVFLVGGGLLAGIGWQFPFLVYLFAFVVLPLAVYLVQEPPKVGDHNAAGEVLASMPWSRTLPIYLLGFFSMVVFYLVPVQIPFLLTQTFQAPPAMIGFSVGSLTLTMGLLAPTFQRVKGRFASPAIFAYTFALLGLGLGLVSSTWSYPVVLAGLALAGMGLAYLFPNLNTVLVAVLPPTFRGRGMGLMSMAIFLGQFSSPILVSPLVPWLGLPGMFGVCSALLGLVSVGFLLAWFQQGRNRALQAP
ncbi:MAG: hypothetical protein A2600_09440 [Candidatus Lambdaproteobacteria bacterium RIFOXYD1_FULL_56_27]|uniref:Major facilitator superfamily (MFS) profile domain-containing protein n=1 Tax=Candidatus Lambdaproteobacteria bacterium RIFOXYD2_FULL_56_26 TaxID=1817773 RepID=A0A1F6GV83_9PROT|nr:MAG: hypothetical protein A2557_04710 [Candidatus Lambdaproteobacteria bacterium RIFOXYD2_FULL_56_26]OGH02330.1 MAG: hypothetical protein A2426_03190 [Candidatus Lambdaproteobacteria bacterium RIFOXYC1_FULL_56_13]OGH10100.1 MAG: hypothetical protein A2600_09440 [Candidatus Lambdaproteobacteria bacterium RIFOXYD1_FULL_56_27]